MNLSEVHQCFWVVIFFQARGDDRITAAQKWLNISTNSSQTVEVVRLFVLGFFSSTYESDALQGSGCQSSVRAVKRWQKSAVLQVSAIK